MSEFATFATKEEFFQALRENRDREPGRAKAAVAEEIADAAEAFGDRGVLVSALVEQMSAYHGSGESVKYPVTFARLLKLWDEAPEDFDRYEAHRVFWYFKWVTSSLLDTPDVPLASVQGWIDEMQRRYQKAEEGMQPVYAQKYALAEHIGVGEELAYELWATRGRTPLSDCAACEARSRAHYWIRRGQDERGLAEMAPTFAGESTCAEEPHTSQSVALLPLVRLGKSDEARTMHLTGYRAVRGRDSEVAAVGRHLEFCALTGNEARGLELLAQNRALFAFDGSVHNRLTFLTGVEVLLRRLVATGHGDLPCAGPVGRQWTVAGLLATLGAEADALAGRFDARNGTDAVSRERLRRLTAGPLVAELNLGVRSAVLQEAESASSASNPATESVPTNAAGASATGVAATAATAVPDDFAELLAAARDLDKKAHPDARRLWGVVAERAAGPDAGHVDDLVRGELAFERAYRAHRDDEWDAARAAFREAADWYGKAGRTARVLSSEARLAWSQATAGTRGPARPARIVEAAAGVWPRLDELAAAMAEERAAGFPSDELRQDAEMQQLVLRQCRVLVARNAVLRGGDDHPDHEHWAGVFERECDLLLAEGTEFGSPLRASLAYEVRAEYLGSTEDFEGSEQQSREAVRIFEENGLPWRLHRPRMMIAVAAASRGRLAEAAAELQTALAAAHPATEPEELTPLYRVLGDISMQSGDFATAVRVYSEAAVRLDRAGDAFEAVQTRWRMSKAMTAQGQTADAVAVLETLVDADLGAEASQDADAGSDAAVDSAAAVDAVDTTVGVDTSVAVDTSAAAETGAAAVAEPSRAAQLITQIRVDLGHGLLELEEPRAAAVEFLRVADTVGGWPDRSLLTYAAAKAALALALADTWDGARKALTRALAANEAAPCLPDVTDVLRDVASAAMRAHGEEGFDEAMGLLAEADAIRDRLPETAAEQFTSVEYDVALTMHVRGKVLLTVGRAEEALAAFDAAIGHFDHAGHPTTSDRFEAVRMAAITELNHLERAEAAHRRLDAAVREAEACGHRQAAEILGRLRDAKR